MVYFCTSAPITRSTCIRTVDNSLLQSTSTFSSCFLLFLKGGIFTSAVAICAYSSHVINLFKLFFAFCKRRNFHLSRCHSCIFIIFKLFFAFCKRSNLKGGIFTSAVAICAYSSYVINLFKLFFAFCKRRNFHLSRCHSCISSHVNTLSARTISPETR